MSDKKAAEAEVKKAQKAWETAAKKAEKSRATYLADQAAANAAARELQHARTHPALFDDDPLSVVTPDGLIPQATPEAITAAVAAVAEPPRQAVVEHVYEQLPANEEPEAVSAPEAPKATPRARRKPAAEVAPPAETGAEPWDAPQQTPPPAAAEGYTPEPGPAPWETGEPVF